MLKLPKNNHLPIQKFVGVFNSTTNSELVFDIISLVWYPVNYYKISFGKQDTLCEKIFLLKKTLNLQANLNSNDLLNTIKSNNKNSVVIAIVNDITRYVPFRFLTPWFDVHLRGLSDSNKNKKIEFLSNNNLEDEPLYCINSTNKTIKITNEWYEYLYTNMQIIKDFTYWNLLQYLENRNPNIPNISQKLFEPVSRKLSTAREFWKIVINETGNIKCIYSNEVIKSNHFAIDHYIPWSFVTHDKLWNLIPTTSIVNSKKRNKIPSLQYFNTFAEVQYKATIIILSESPKSKYLEDYLLLFRINLKELNLLSLSDFQESLKTIINPLGQIASNSGFSSNWLYTE